MAARILSAQGPSADASTAVPAHESGPPAAGKGAAWNADKALDNRTLFCHKASGACTSVLGQSALVVGEQHGTKGEAVGTFLENELMRRGGAQRPPSTPAPHLPLAPGSVGITPASPAHLNHPLASDGTPSRRIANGDAALAQRLAHVGDNVPAVICNGRSDPIPRHHRPTHHRPRHDWPPSGSSHAFPGAPARPDAHHPSPVLQAQTPFPCAW